MIAFESYDLDFSNFVPQLFVKFSNAKWLAIIIYNIMVIQQP